jgi:hypothetical protein
MVGPAEGASGEAMDSKGDFAGSKLGEVLSLWRQRRRKGGRKSESKRE